MFGSLKRLLIWVLLLTTWEAAYRTVQWRPWVFPAPSHIVDSLLNMLNVRTAFGEPVRAGWPWQEASSASAKSPINSPLVIANIVSLSRLAVGFGLSIVLGGLLGLAMWRFKSLDDFLG